MDIFLEQHKNFLLLLLKHEVEFMLIGGYAVIYYGYERGTEDMDLWLKPTNANRDKFIEALKEHGVSRETLTAVKEMDFTTTLVMYIGEKPNTIEFLTKVQGVTYEEADKEKVMLPLKDKQIPVIQYHHLVLTKIATGRTKDKADIEELQKINRNKKNP
jgi:NACalpha-BTF3-like transcription factor